jgi:hypothetical protein
MGDAEVSVGHVACRLLVARRNQLDPVLAFPQAVEQADVAVAADAEDVRHPLADQELGDEIATLHARHDPFPRDRRSQDCDADGSPAPVLSCDDVEAFSTISQSHATGRGTHAP